MYKLLIFFSLSNDGVPPLQLSQYRFKVFPPCSEETCKILGPSREASLEDETVQRMSIKSHFLRRVESVDFMVQDVGILALSGLCIIINLVIYLRVG